MSKTNTVHNALNTLIKKIIKAWDPDFTKVTLKERISLAISDAEMKKGKYISEEEVWSKVQ